MTAPMDGGLAEEREVNPLLFVVFCPNCVLGGLFALAAGGVITLPPLFGVAATHYLTPAVVLGTFLGWLAWGRWEKGKDGCSSRRGREMCLAGSASSER